MQYTAHQYNPSSIRIDLQDRMKRKFSSKLAPIVSVHSVSPASLAGSFGEIQPSCIPTSGNYRNPW